MSLESDIRQMRRSPIFQQLSVEALRLLAFSSETRILKQGDALFTRGEASDCAFLVLQGALEVSSAGSEDSVVKDSRRAQPGDLLGERALFVETERQGSAVAIAPCKVLKISRAVFLRVLDEYPQAAIVLRDLISKKLDRFVRELRTIEKTRSGA